MSNADRELQSCVGCRKQAPETNTEYTLISARFGWRLTRRTNREGAFVMEWRCPACWQRYKTERQLAMTPTDGLPAFNGEGTSLARRESGGENPPPPSSRRR